LVIALIYVLWAVFIPMTIGQKWVDRKVTENSQQYVSTQRSALVNLYASYTAADDEHRKGIKVQMCEIANTLPSEEIPTSVRSIVGGCL
jgi:hypothetical protein